MTVLEVPKKTLFAPHEVKNFLATMRAAAERDEAEKAIEHTVNNVFKDYFSRAFGEKRVTLAYPYSTDGLLTVASKEQDLVVLFESKRDLNFSTNRSHLVEVLIQVAAYLTRFRNEGDTVPAVSVVSDNNEIFSVPTTQLVSYLDEFREELSVATPSGAGKALADLNDRLYADNNIRPYVHALIDTFDLDLFCRNVTALALGADLVKVTVTPENLSALYQNYIFDVFNGPAASAASNREQIDMFIAQLRGDDGVYAHPSKHNVLVYNGREISGVDVHANESFWARYDTNYSLPELKAITEIADTLIVDAKRRFTGDFWTPSVWVRQAHEMIENALGEDWREEYVVWDPAAGAKNLTRDYRFEKLYTSTLFEEDLRISQLYNVGSTAFQYDFLNDDMWMHEFDGNLREYLLSLDDVALASKFALPLGLVKALLNKEKIVFFANPPYGQATSGQGRDHKAGASSETGVAKLMDGLGHARMELYTQFIFRVQLLAQVFEYESDFHFFFFNKGFLTAPTFGKFTTRLLEEFTFHDGFMLNAGEFSGTSSAWGIIFSHWEVGGREDQFLEFDVLRSTAADEVEKIAEWEARVPDGSSLSAWMKEIPVPKELNPHPAVTRNGFDPPNKPSVRVKPRKEAFGYLLNIGDSVQKSDGYLTFTSMGMAQANGRDVTRDNFTRAAVTFSVRRSVQEVIARQKLLWVRDKDVFTRPSDALVEDASFIADCVVYSLFDRQSNQTSLRDYSYGGKRHRVVNHFYPFSHAETTQWAVDANNLTVQTDADGDTDRFVHQWLTENDEHLSDNARALLDYARELYRDSFHLRERFAQERPRYQTNTWDSGWVQVYRMIFGQDRVHDGMLDRRPEFDRLVRTLGDTIAQRAFDDGII